MFMVTAQNQEGLVTSMMSTMKQGDIPHHGILIGLREISLFGMSVKFKKRANDRGESILEKDNRQLREKLHTYIKKESNNE